MSGLRLFNLGDGDVRTESSIDTMSDMTSIGLNNVTINDSGIQITNAGSAGVQMTDSGYLRIAGATNTSQFNGGIIFVDSAVSVTEYWHIYSNTSGSDKILRFNSSVGGTTPYMNSAGSTIQMNFTGQHRTLGNKNIGINQEGLIVSSDNDYVNLDNGVSPTINESLPVISLSNTDYDKKVFGVISNLEDDNNDRNYLMGSFGTTYEKTNYDEQRLIVNSLGEGSIWICNKNGIFENGDFITSSSVVGYGIKQNDDLLHNYTVGKITCNCDFSLIKVPEQQLKTTAGTSGQVIDYDSNGNLQFENKTDSEGNVILDYKFQTRFLQADGTLLTDEADYQTRLANGEEVYIACFAGCTYHCG